MSTLAGACAQFSAGGDGAAGLVEVFVVRHGETEWNREGRRQGLLDSPLTRSGLAAAHRQAAEIAELPVDGVFTSPLGRASRTAEIYASALGLSPVVVNELSEVDHGTMSGMTTGEVESAFPGALAERVADLFHWRYPEGESYADADARAARALARIAASGARRPLVVSHEMIGRMLVRNLLDLARDDALALTQPHDILYRVDLHEGELERRRLGVD